MWVLSTDAYLVCSDIESNVYVHSLGVLGMSEGGMTMTRRRTLQSENGQVLVLMPVIFLAALALSGLVVDVGNGYLTQHRLQTALDAGALVASQDLVNGKSTSTAVADANQMVSVNGFSNIAFNPSNQTGPNIMTIDTSTDKVMLTSTLAVPTYFMKVFSQNKMNISVSSAAASQGNPVFNYALFANKSIDLPNNNLNVGGSIHSNGSLTMTGNNEDVTGNVEVHGSYSEKANHTTYGGELETSAPVIPMPQLDINQYEAMAEANGEVYNGDLIDTQDNNVTLSNIVFVNGNVDIETNNLYCNMIVATGKITIHVNNITQTNTSQSLISIFSNSDIDIEDNNSKNLTGFLYAPNGDITVHGNNCAVSGAVIAQTMTIDQNNINVTYNSAVQSMGPRKAVLVTG